MRQGSREALLPMASVTPAAGGIGHAPHLSGGATSPFTTLPARYEPQAPRTIERIGSVRILRGDVGTGWRGVALRLAADTGREENLFELTLTSGNGRSVTIATVCEEEAIALWRDCGRSTGLPLLLETPEGEITEPYPQLGRVALGPIRIRRRYGLLNGRRPRFLVRRKTGKPALRPVVVSGERLTD